MTARPQRVPADGPAGPRHDLRGRPARRPAERGGDRGRRGQGRVHRAARRRRACASSRRPASSTRTGCRSSPMPRSCSANRDAVATASAIRSSCRTSAASTARSPTASRDIAIFGSATETFAQRNLNRTVDEAVRDVRAGRRAGARARSRRPRVRLDVLRRPVGRCRRRSTQVVDVGARLLDLGCTQLCLGDTIGVGTAGHVTALLAAFAARGVGVDRLAVHFHDTYGQALANTLAALQAGITTVDASAGGLGGCPYAKNATGNLATEDLVWLLGRARHRDRRRSRASWSRRASGWPLSSGGRARRASCARSPADRRQPAGRSQRVQRRRRRRTRR